jgi:hypothetical protein
VKLTYDRKLRAYSDGKYLYVSKSGIVKSWEGVDRASPREFTRRKSPDLGIISYGAASPAWGACYRFTVEIVYASTSVRHSLWSKAHERRP